MAAKWRERLEVFFSISNLKWNFRYKRYNNPRSKDGDDDDDDDPNKKLSIFYVSMDGNSLLDDEPLTRWGGERRLSPHNNRTPEIRYRQELFISDSL